MYNAAQTMINQGKNSHLARLLMLILLFFIGRSSVAQVSPEVRTTLIAEIDFVPEILEMIRKSLSRKIARPVSLAFQPDGRSESILRRPDLLLIEDGVATASLPLEFSPTPWHIDLVWVLAYRPENINFSTASPSLEDFGRVLLQLKAANPNVYPWFESLYSKETLLNFSKLFVEAKTKSGYEKLPFWQQSGMVKMLYRAMEQGLLNPLSVEADQALATKVFLAGDAQCFSIWVPLELLDNSWLVGETFGDAKITAFPGQGGKRFPGKVLRLWKHDEIMLNWNFTAPASSSLVLIDADYAVDHKWLKFEAERVYDRLIMGDF